MNTEDLKTEISSHGAVLVYFFSDSCAPCIALRPKVSELLENEFPKMKLLMLDAAGNPSTAADFNAFSLPVLVIYFDGKEYRRFSKYISVSELRESIRRVYDVYFSG